MGGRRDGLASSLRAARNPQRRSLGPPSRLRRRGVADPTRLKFLDPPPPRRARGGPSSSPISRRSTPSTASPIAGAPSVRCRCRRVSRAWCSRRRASGPRIWELEIAALVVERGLGGTSTDLAERLEHFARDRSERARSLHSLAAQWAKTAKAAKARDTLGEPPSPGLLLALAYLERLARARGRNGEYLLANGRAAALDPADPMARAPFLAVAEIAGRAAAARILLAASIERSEIEAEFASHIELGDDLAFDATARALRRRRQRRLGALLLEDAPAPSRRTKRRRSRSQKAWRRSASTSCLGRRSSSAGEGA